MLAVASDNECITHDTSISLSYQRPVAFPVKAAFSPLSLHGMRQGKPIQFSWFFSISEIRFLLLINLPTSFALQIVKQKTPANKSRFLIVQYHKAYAKSVPAGHVKNDISVENYFQNFALFKFNGILLTLTECSCEWTSCCWAWSSVSFSFGICSKAETSSSSECPWPSCPLFPCAWVDFD